MLILSKLTSFGGKKNRKKLSALLRMSPRGGRNKEAAARNVKRCPGPSSRAEPAQVLWFEKKEGSVPSASCSLNQHYIIYIKNKNYFYNNNPWLPIAGTCTRHSLHFNPLNHHNHLMSQVLFFQSTDEESKGRSQRLKNLLKATYLISSY